MSGFCDAEACFTVSISLKSKDKWKVKSSFEISLHLKDIDILYKIKKFFKDKGNIYLRKNKNICVYRINKLRDLNETIIVHFDSYPLLSGKYSDYIYWKKSVDLMLLKEHLNKIGFLSILKLYASINRGMSKQVTKIYSTIEPYPKIISSLPKNLDPNWVSGFVAGDGSFVLGLRNNTNISNKSIIYYNFNIT